MLHNPNRKGIVSKNTNTLPLENRNSSKESISNSSYLMTQNYLNNPTQLYSANVNTIINTNNNNNINVFFNSTNTINKQAIDQSKPLQTFIYPSNLNINTNYTQSQIPISANLPVSSVQSSVSNYPNYQPQFHPPTSTSHSNDSLTTPPTKQKKMRKPFSVDEDHLLTNIMYGKPFTTWIDVAAQIPGRSARQCRDRWANYLSPNNKNGPWSRGEDEILAEKHREYGSQWTVIAKFFDGRSENNVKNRWYTHLKHKYYGKNQNANKPKSSTPSLDNVQNFQNLSNIQFINNNNILNNYNNYYDNNQGPIQYASNTNINYIPNQSSNQIKGFPLLPPPIPQSTSQYFTYPPPKVTVSNTNPSINSYPTISPINNETINLSINKYSLDHDKKNLYNENIQSIKADFNTPKVSNMVETNPKRHLLPPISSLDSEIPESKIGKANQKNHLT
ncbi:hypothetical protein M9Y10_040929 [Tritrichomonas musculus]|uniref:Myb-like DNA-binding domain containing protein n=1 Tax=Tritrichomonas musculus TaxID=1915356 RepID=A0ABR2K2Y7_9EUKA